MTLYGYPRQPEPESPDSPAPESPDAGGMFTPEAERTLGRVPIQRVSTDPVPDPWTERFAEPAEAPVAPDRPADPLAAAAEAVADAIGLADLSVGPIARPDRPGTPDLPGLPDLPGIPDLPGMQDLPGVPDLPAGPIRVPDFLGGRMPVPDPPSGPISLPDLPPGPIAMSDLPGVVAGDKPAGSGSDGTVPPLVIREPIVYLDDIEEPTHIPEWDRKPLMVVLAASAVLVLLAVLSGVVTSAVARRGQVPAAWHGPDAEPSPTTTASAPAVQDDTITLAGVGDVIMGTQPKDLPPRGGEGFFDAVKDTLKADLVMGNLETPLTDDTGRDKCPKDPTPAPTATTGPTPTRSSGCFQLFLPRSYAQHLRDGGFHLLNLANNHTNDMGAEGLRNTRAALRSVGIQYTGGPNEITYVDVKEVRVAVIGFSVYSWSQNLNNISAAKALVRRADDKADIVVVQMQGGAEGADKSHVKPGTERFLGENRGDLIAFTHAVVDAGADVVFGHGPHIMRGMEFYRGRLIAFSLGNFCGYGVLSTTGFLGVGGVLRVTLREDGTWAGGELVATEMVRGGLPALDDDRRALAFVRRLSREDFGANAAGISTSTGAITPPGDG